MNWLGTCACGWLSRGGCGCGGPGGVPIWVGVVSVVVVSQGVTWSRQGQDDPRLPARADCKGPGQLLDRTAVTIEAARDTSQRAGSVGPVDRGVDGLLCGRSQAPSSAWARKDRIDRSKGSTLQSIDRSIGRSVVHTRNGPRTHSISIRAPARRARTAFRGHIDGVGVKFSHALALHNVKMKTNKWTGKDLRGTIMAAAI